eukprot:Sdes_comp15272_c0_seq1m4117
MALFKRGLESSLPAISKRNTLSPQSSSSSGYKGLDDFGGGHSEYNGSSALRRFNTNLGNNPAPFEEISSGRVLQLEGRVEINEKSNRALLEEIVGLQGEIKSRFRRNDDLIQEEKQGIAQLSENLESNNKVLSKMITKYEKLDGGVYEAGKHISQLMNQQQDLEKKYSENFQQLQMMLSQDQVKLDHVFQSMEENHTSFDKYKQTEHKKFNL